MKPYYLISYFGTIVYLDPITSMLRHGAIGTVPENVIVNDLDGTCSIYYEFEGTTKPISDLGPGGCRCSDGDRTVCTLERRLHGEDRYTFHWSGRVLTAESDGHVSLFRSMVGHWEIFMPLTMEELSELKFIVLSSWAQRMPAKIFSPADIVLQEGCHIRFGDYTVPESELRRLVRAPIAARPSTSLEIVVMFDGWKFISLRLFRPLVYFVAYGSAEIFACARLAIDSLRIFGRLQSNVMVITDRYHSDRAEEFFGDGTIAVALQSYDVMDFALARYKITEFAIARGFQPILYLDTDVICNSPLDGLFQAMCFTDHLHAVPEGMLMTEADFYGRTLFELDPGVGFQGDSGFSTGVLGFRNVACVESLFRPILISAYEYARLAARRDCFPAFDQPFANYIVRKGFPELRSMEMWAVGSSYVVEPSYEKDSRRGLIHFAGGVGNAKPKIDRMREYFTRLAEEANA